MISASNPMPMHDALSKEFAPEDLVYLTDEYYDHFNATIVEVPRFGWTIKAISPEGATIEFHRPKLKMQIQLEVDVRYLKREI